MSHSETELVDALRAAGCGIVRRPAPYKPEGITLEGILRTVSEETGVAIADLTARWRDPKFVRARFIYYTIAREFTGATLAGIGNACGGKHHTTILHSLRFMAENPDKFEPEYSRVRNRIRNRGRVA